MIKPFQHHIVVKRVKPPPPPEKIGSIIVPQISKPKPITPDTTEPNMSLGAIVELPLDETHKDEKYPFLGGLRTGDRIWFPNGAGYNMDRDHVVLPPEAVIGVEG